MAGLPEDGGTCPGATTGEGGCLWSKNEKGAPTCYAKKIQRIYPSLTKVLNTNTAAVTNKSFDELVITLRNTVIKFLLNNKGGKQVFRLHVSGDFFSLEYAKAWAYVMKEWPLVKFWAYTRSYTEEINVVPIFAGIINMSLYISVDPQNKARGLEVYNQYKQFTNIGIAALGETVVEGIRFIPCPELAKKVNNCGACKLCFTHTDKIKLRPIKFKLH